MSFFASVPQAEPVLAQPTRPSIPTWIQPSNEELPVAVHLGRVLGRVPGCALTLLRADVYTSGVMFKLQVNAWVDDDRSQDSWDEKFHRVERFAMGRGDAAGRLRLGLTLPGGATIDTESQSGFSSFEDEPDGPLLRIGGGGGGGSENSFVSFIDAWLWPLPEAGDATLHFVCEGLGMTEGSTEIDTRELLKASKNVLKLRS